MSDLNSTAQIENQILFVRGYRVMLDRDLANLYGVATKALNQAVRRNRDRFPADFMFQLTWAELETLQLRSQIVTLEKGKHIKYLPLVFTEHGVAMLSSVLRSSKAVQVNIEIMRTFARLRTILASHKDLAAKMVQLENKYDAQFKIVFDTIRQLMAPPATPKPGIGFKK